MPLKRREAPRTRSGAQSRLPNGKPFGIYDRFITPYF